MPDPLIENTFEPLVGRAVVLTGPTASGKSSLAIRLAQQLDGEILSLDSIAVYRGMDIGTAKATPEEQQQVPHHLIDLADPDEEFSVACYLAAAHEQVNQVLRRGKLPLFVGGTPMFLKAILRGFDPGPPPDWDFRKSVEEDLLKHGAEALVQRLQQVDPLSAHRIAPGDTRRMIRALEVAKLTGVPMSHRQIQFDKATPADQCNVFSMVWPRPKLHERINQRVNEMFQSGLVDEVRSLVNRYGTLSRTASQAVGYREVIEGLETDQGEGEIRDLVATHTRQLAKRQETWFRSFSEITPLKADEQSDPEFLVGRVAQQIKSLPAKAP